MIATRLKQPGETLRVSLAIVGVPVAIGAATVESRGLAPGAAALLAATALDASGPVVVLTGGGDGERYLVTVRITDSVGAVIESELEVAVVEARWQLPDGGTPYLSIVDFVKRVGLDEVVRMTDVAGTGRIDRELLVGALADAQAIVEAHLARRYALPLDPVPPPIAVALSDLARNRLYPGGAPEGVKSNAATAMRLLERVQSGAVPLDAVGAAPPQAASATPVLIAPGRREYPDGLAGY